MVRDKQVKTEAAVIPDKRKRIPISTASFGRYEPNSRIPDVITAYKIAKESGGTIETFIKENTDIQQKQWNQDESRKGGICEKNMYTACTGK